MARNWGKKYEEVSKRMSKKGKLAAEGHHLKQQADKKLATESLEDKMKRTGVTNFETEEVVDYNVANADDDVWGFMNKSFYNKLIADTKLQAEKEVEEMMMEQFKAMLNEVLDARESNKRAEEIKLAELRIRELELQVELAKLQSAPVEFELTPMVPVTHGKLEEVIEEHSTAVNTILDAIEVTEKPAKKQRKATIKKKGSSRLTLSTICTPLNKGRSGYSVAWSKVPSDEAGFLNVIIPIVEFAIDNGINVNDTNEFRKFHPVCQGAYMQYTKKYPGQKGVWKAFIAEHFNK
jgi:hypothetical protein